MLVSSLGRAMVNEQQRQLLLDRVHELVDAGAIRDAYLVLHLSHPADQADVIERIDEEERTELLKLFHPEEFAEVIEYLDEEVRSRITRALPPEVLAPLLDQMDEDIAADIVQDLPEDQQSTVVQLLEEPQFVQELLTYPEESAGGRMLTDVVALRRDWTVDDALRFLRQEVEDADQPFYLYVVDDDGKLAGVVSLRAIVTSTPETPIAAITSPTAYSVRVDEDQEIAAERMRHYGLLALPVIDEENRLRGVITIDRVLDVQVEEATEDMLRLAGLSDEERLFRPLRQGVPPRLGWLSVNLITAFLAAATVSFFEGTIEDFAALAVFMPIVAGMGGNAGIQTITLVVRAVALGEVDVRDVSRVLRHELTIAAIKGVFIGSMTGLIAYIWMDNAWLGLVVGVALMANIANATVAGVLVPLGLRRVGADPALASGIIVTMLSDVLGFFIFLGLATLLISQLL